MRKDKYKVYVAGPWFTENQDRVQTKLEEWVRGRDDLEPFFPRHDGIKMEPDEIQDPEIRRVVFNDNISHIKHADLVIANLDGRDGYQDTGTVYEVGYAQAHSIPVIGYQDGPEGKMPEHMHFLQDYILMVTDLESLERSYHLMGSYSKYLRRPVQNTVGNGVILASPHNNEGNKQVSKWIEESLHTLYSNIINLQEVEGLGRLDTVDEIFQGSYFILANIDDRDPIVSWSIGQAYARGIPVISYSDHDYGVNIMLLQSIKAHVKGRGELLKVLRGINDWGINSIEEIDTSKFKAY